MREMLESVFEREREQEGNLSLSYTQHRQRGMEADCSDVVRVT